MKKISPRTAKTAADYQALGWQHELWDVVRYFRSIGKNEKNLREFWLKHLNEKSSLVVIVVDKAAKKGSTYLSNFIASRSGWATMSHLFPPGHFKNGIILNLVVSLG